MREGVAEVAARVLAEVHPVLHEHVLVEPEFAYQLLADGRIDRAVNRPLEWVSGGDVNQDEDERDDGEDDGERRKYAPYEPYRHLTLHAVSIDVPVGGNAPGAQESRPRVGPDLHVLHAGVHRRHVLDGEQE